jgi:branched-chain amino acid transport system ATP-binding protein
MTGLQASGIVKRFGGLIAVDGADVTVEPGGVVALIGPNGAGKTTLFDCLTGMTHVDAGRISLDGRDITSLSAHDRSRAGLARTFQRLEVFGGMTALENLQVAVEARTPGAPWLNLLNLGHAAEARARDAAMTMLTRLGLERFAGVPAQELPTGVLRMLELGRALSTEPSVLLLDEPASGLDHDEVGSLRSAIAEAASSGVAVLIVEHDVELVLDVSDVVLLMDRGRIVASGPPEQVRQTDAFLSTYLGRGAAMTAPTPST